jgi:hypothetical protein
MLAAPDFKGVGFDAEIGGGLVGVEFGFVGHDYAPLLILPRKDVFRSALKKHNLLEEKKNFHL